MLLREFLLSCENFISKFMKIIDQIKKLYEKLEAEEQKKLLQEFKLKQKGTTVEYNKEPNCCPHCQSKKIIKHSYYKDNQRFKCKSCNRTFIPTTGTLVHNIKKRDQFSEYSKIIKDEGLRTIDYMAKKLNISIPTSFEWRHKILLSIPKKKDKFEDEVQADDLWFLYSQKGRKGLKFARKRGGSKRIGDNDFQVKIIAASDKNQVEMKVAKIGRISKIDIIQAIGEKFKKGGKLVTDGHRSFSAFAKSEKLNHVSFISKKHKAKTGENVQYINNMAGRLVSLINYTLRGVSTKYLQLYASYFAYTEKTKFELNSEFTKNTKVWDIFTNIETMYKNFISKKSKRTYRCPTLKFWKSQNWNNQVVSTLSYI
jgi:transposase-like protein